MAEAAGGELRSYSSAQLLLARATVIDVLQLTRGGLVARCSIVIHVMHSLSVGPVQESVTSGVAGRHEVRRKERIISRVLRSRRA
jgi:hypothetical protein